MSEPVEIILVGNKIDLREERIITKESAKQALESFGKVQKSDKKREDKYKENLHESILGKSYVEVTAKDTDAVDDLFK